MREWECTWFELCHLAISVPAWVKRNVSSFSFYDSIDKRLFGYLVLIFRCLVT